MKILQSITLLCCCAASLCAQSKQTFLATEISVAGGVAQPMKFNVASMMKFKSVSVPETPVKNHKGDVVGQASGFKGVLLRDILDSAKIKMATIRDASRLAVVVRAPDGYAVVYSAHEIFNTDVGDGVYVLFEKNGKEIPAEEGGQFRMLSVKDRITGPRHFKWLQTIDVVEVK